TEPRQAASPSGGLRFDVDSFFKDHDRNHDGYLTREELPRRLRHAFEQLDTNKDGRISRQELEQGVVHLQPRRRPSGMEYVLIELSHCDECFAEELQVVYDALRRFDKNGDGKIDASELKAAREELVRQRVDDLLEDLDTDKDGRISRQEARGLLRQNFDRL